MFDLKKFLNDTANNLFGNKTASKPIPATTSIKQPQTVQRSISQPIQQIQQPKVIQPVAQPIAAPVIKQPTTKLVTPQVQQPIQPIQKPVAQPYNAVQKSMATKPFVAKPDDLLTGAAKTFYGGVNTAGATVGSLLGSVLPIGDSNVYSSKGRSNLVRNLQNETYNPDTKQWFTTGQDTVKKAQTDFANGNTEANLGNLGSTLLNASMFLPASAGVSAATSLGKATAKDAAKNIFTSGLIGGGYSGLSGAANAMQNNASLPEVIQQGASNIPLGFALGAGIPLAAKGAQVAGSKVVNTVKNPKYESGSFNVGQLVSDVKNKISGRPTNLTDAELDAARNMTAYNSGWGNNPTIQDARLARQAEVKLKQQPGTPAGMQALNDAVNAHRAYNETLRQRQSGSVPAGMFDPTGKLGKEDTATQVTKTPVIDETMTAERGLIQSAKKSKNVSTAAKAKLDELDKMYEIRNNKELNATVAKKLDSDPTRAHEFAVSNNSDEGTVAAIQLAQNYRKTGQYDLEASLITEKAKRLTEAGREIQAARMMDELSPEATVLSAAQTINRYNEQALLKNKPLIPELTGEKAKIFSDTADNIAKMPEGRDKNIALYQLKTDLANLIPSTAASKLVTIWKAGLLTSPRTTLRNIVGNTIHGISEIAKDPFAAVNDITLSKKTGNRELTMTTKGGLSGAAQGVRSSADILKYGFDPEKTIEKFGVNHITWDNTPIQQAMKKYTDTVFNFLGAQDKLFYKASETRSLYDQAGAAAINAGRKGDKAFIKNLVENPTERMKINSTKDAQTAVFQNSNVGSQTASKVKNLLRDKNSGLGAIADIVMPFTGVPSSIAGQMVAYSPIGLTKGIAKDYKIFAGKVTPNNLPDFQRQASQEIGRGVIGSGLLGLGAYLTAKGLMTGQPKDANEAKQWELEGRQANSIMIGGKWRSINSVGPETLVLLAGGKLGQGNDIGTAAGNIGKDFLGQTFLSGIQQPLNAISDPVRYGGTYISGQVPSVIPNVVKDVAKAFDPTQRETKSTGNIVESTINATKAGIPGLRNTLLPKRDALGNELKQEPSGVGAFVDLFNSKTPIKNTIVDELSRLYKADQSATPSQVAASQTILGQKVILNPQQLDKLEQTTGQPITKQFESIIKSPEYSSATDEMKKKVLDNITSNAKNSAKMDMVTGTNNAQSSVSPTGVIDTSKLSNQNKITLNKDTFDKSGKNYEEKDGYIYRRNSEGTVTVTPKISFEHDLNTANLTQLKEDDDLQGWMDQAKIQSKNIRDQLADPSVDPLEKVQLTNELNSLVKNAEKYDGYGGFTKASGSKSGGKIDYAKLFTASYKSKTDQQDALRQLLSGIKITRKKIS